MGNQTLSYLIIFLGGVSLTLVGLWLRRMIVRHLQSKRELTNRISIEDTLKHFYHLESKNGTPLPESVAGILGTSVAEATNILTEMQQHQLITNTDNHWRLTPTGRNYALQVIRAHRLWERYLADKTGYPESEWHTQSDKLEHQLSQAETDALADSLGNPRFDPHGDPIPTAEGKLPPAKHIPLPVFPVGKMAKIVHLEDEPEAIYHQLGEKGLHLGTILQVVVSSMDGIEVELPSGRVRLNSAQAANVSVVPARPDEIAVPEPTVPLSELKPGEQGRVVSISPACKGAERRRMMDLGIVPGTIIRAEMVSPSGDPTAYLIRGALIALRQEQAALINVSRNLQPNHHQQKSTMPEVTA